MTPLRTNTGVGYDWEKLHNFELAVQKNSNTILATLEIATS